MKRYFSLFYRKSPVFYVVITFIGILNSALNSTFMIVVSKSVSNTDYFIFSGYYPWIFFLLFAMCVGLNVLFYSYMIRLSSNIVNEVELDLIQMIRRSSFSNLSRIGNEEIYSAMRNLAILGEAPGKFITIFISFLTVMGCLIYLFLISYIYGIIITSLIGMIVYSYFFRSRMWNDKFKMLRDLQIDYYKQLGDLLLGFKDLKMSSVKNESIYSKFILKNRQTSRELDIKLKYKLSNNALITNYAWYLFLGVVLFVLPRWRDASLYNPSAFVIILVYIIGPVTTITSFFPFLAGLKIAADSLDSIKVKLSRDEDVADVSRVNTELNDFSSIQFREVCFEYIDEHHGRMFSLGPINIEVNEGELIFLIGGNGSGKSTFINILTGLQKPLSGQIYYNKELIKDSLYVAYRDKIAAVFSDGYLLRNNYEEFELDQYNEKFVQYLRIMKLEEVVSSKDMFESKDNLSKGQQKRLVLILSLLMNKKILVLDEWAAEQDPDFKEYFYRHVLPFLKNEGKTIIAITHDEQYLSCADKVIKFRDGKVVC